MAVKSAPTRRTGDPGEWTKPLGGFFNVAVIVLGLSA